MKCKYHQIHLQAGLASSFLCFLCLVLLCVCLEANAQEAPIQANESESTEKQEGRSELTQEEIEKFTIEGSMKQAEIDWMESLHARVSNTVFLSAFWFDSFFTEEDTEQERPDINARIRLGWEPKTGDLAEYESKFRVRVKLPHFTDKMDVILSDDEEDNINNLPLENVNAKPEISEDRFSAAVRFVHHNGSDQVTDTRLGISSGDIFLRARYKRNFSWQNKHGLRVEPALYYFVDDGVGARLMLEYDYQMTAKSQFRFNYSIRGSESFSGIRWKHGAYHLQQFSLSEAGALGLVTEGERNGERGFIIDKYTLSYRYRFNAYKKWLFFEVEPFVEWAEREDYRTAPGLALRVEGYFYRNN